MLTPAAVAVPAPHHGRAERTQWIISAPEDLVWFIGSVVVSYAALSGLYLGIPPIVVILVWAVLFDGTHVFATVSRTYLDTEERRARALLLWGSLGFFALGPALSLSGYHEQLVFFALLWAYYHLVKQHYGFMVLYKKKNDDLGLVDNAVDRTFLLAGTYYPFVYFLERRIAGAGGLFFIDPHSAAVVETLTWWALLASAAAFALRQLQKMLQRTPLNAPKLLLLAAVLSLHWVVFALIADHPFGLMLAVPVLSLFHNLQYHRLVWFYNRNKYGDQATVRRYGWATTVSRSLLFYGVVAVVFSCLYQIPPRLLPDSQAWLAALFMGWAFNHYYLDGKIWRVRHDPGLDTGLRMPPAGA